MWMVFLFSKCTQARDQIGADTVSAAAKSVAPKLAANVVDVGAGTVLVVHRNAAGAKLIVRAKDAKAQTE